MSELNALARKLAALAATEDLLPGGARRISVDGTPAPMVAILNEIDDTVLERTLEIVADDNAVSLIVAGRRLRGILSVTPADSDTASVTGRVLARDEPQVLHAALALIQQLCESATHVTVKSNPPVPFGKGGDRGISTDGLAEVLSLPQNEPSQPPVSHFLTENAARLSAVLHLHDNEVVAIHGDAAALKTIWDTQVQAFRKAHRKHLGGKDGPQLICFEGALDDGMATALALAGDDIALLAYRPDHLGAMLASWRAITS